MYYESMNSVIKVSLRKNMEAMRTNKES